MWTRLAHIILRYRLYLMIAIAVITAFMAYQAQFIKWSYSLANIVPDSDEEMGYFQSFKETFGEDGNVMVIGVQDSAIFTVEHFHHFRYLIDEITRQEGVTGVMGLPNLQVLQKNEQKRTFDVVPLFKEIPDDQSTLDSLLAFASRQKFYSGQLINPKTGATLVLVTLDKEIINSKKRDRVVMDVVFAVEQFEEKTNLDLHIAGLPYVRTINTTKVKAELNLFLMLSILITGIILFLFFRSFKAVIFPLIIIGIIVVWVLGTLALFGFEITLLSGLIPPIIVVIGIPNSVYMLNKYHHEYQEHGDQMKALSRIIRKIGVVTFITNVTTAIGFFVLISTNIKVLMEFGLVAGLNILATFVVSIILIPSVFSYVKPPSAKHLKHLKFRIVDAVLTGLDFTVHRHPIMIFSTTIGIIIISFFGVMQIEAVSYMVDDIPEKSELKKDLRFFEEHFSGVMPLEVVVDTGQKKGIQNLANLRKINQLELFLDSLVFISQPISPVSMVKASRQAYYNNLPAYYDLPDNRDRAFILRYLQDSEQNKELAKAFVDSTGQTIRISLKMADIGSARMDSLINHAIKPKMDSLFTGTNLTGRVTGSTLIFIKGNRFLIENLITSMIIAFFVIAIIMGALFRNWKMIVISIIPNLIPLIITAGIMGFFGIPLKPSTALIFSIAFGISVDDSIHFLAKYRQELFANKFDVSVAVSKSLRETGSSMIYTSIILFFGFVIFAASEFGGTVALGKLTSITLLFAMLSNLVVLPALLIQFDSGKRDKSIHPLIESYPELAEAETLNETH
jgi:uncharacterized protein